MNIICCDDEKILLECLVIRCKNIKFVDSVNGFRKGTDLLQYVKDNPGKADVAILDINMPDINGLDLAKKILEINPDISIAFLTGYSEYAVDAFKIHASAYLLKPVSEADLTAELQRINESLGKKKITNNPANCPVYARTFGNFDLYVKGKAVSFNWAKSKELLAYLIDCRGKKVSRNDVARVIFEDDEYSRNVQTYLTKAVSELENDLQAAGISYIFLNEQESYSVDQDKLICDMWDFFDGDSQVQKLFQGEYMLQYSWGENRIADFSKITKNYI